MELFNGRVLWMSEAVHAFDIELYTNAADVIGFGAFTRVIGAQGNGLSPEWSGVRLRIWLR